ncbi:MAG: archaeal heat shock protein Hsp20 [Nitrososphaeraceae archaeon]
MNFDIEKDWFGKFLTGSGGRLPGRRADLFGGAFTGFEEMERMFDEQFRDILLQTETPKELVREYVTPGGDKVREIGPIVYGYSAVVGPDGKPRITEFGNVKQGTRIGGKEGTGTRRRGPQLTAEREPLADIITTDKEVKIVVELPGVNKENIKVHAYEGSAEVVAETQDRKYRRVVDIPTDTDAESVKSTFKNGLLEIVFKRKEKPKGKEIKVE